MSCLQRVGYEKSSSGCCKCFKIPSFDASVAETSPQPERSIIPFPLVLDTPLITNTQWGESRNHPYPLKPDLNYGGRLRGS